MCLSNMSIVEKLNRREKVAITKHSLYEVSKEK